MRKSLTICTLLLASMSISAQDNVEPLENVYQEFNFTLFNRVADEDPSQNVFLSPLSAQIALSMMQNGAAGNTLTQMQEALGTTGYTTETVNEFIQQLTSQLTYRPPFVYNPAFGTEEEAWTAYENNHPLCEIANGVWSRAGTHYKEDFYNTLRSYYDAEIGSVDFGTQEGIDEVNGWVNEKTHQMIPTILNEPVDDLVLLLANTLYFKGAWSQSFDIYATHPAKFHTIDGDSIDVNMMYVDATFPHTTNEKFDIVRLSFGLGDFYLGKCDFSMTLYLPLEEGPLPQLTLDDWQTANDMGNAGYPLDITVQLPKFSVEGKYDLIETFKSLGMTDAFEYGLADFSNISDTGLFISKLFQCSKLAVDENGAEAAAVTVVIADESIPMPERVFTFDRPFYLTIENNAAHTILFVGRVMNIEGATGAPQGIDAPQGACRSANHQLYDLQGRRLSSVPTKGVYIQNRKKHVIR